MKRTLRILLVGIMMVSLCGCGKDDYKKTYDKAIDNFKNYQSYKVNYKDIEETESISNRDDYEVTVDRNNKIYKQIKTGYGSKRADDNDYDMTDFEETIKNTTYLDSKENKVYDYDLSCKKPVWMKAAGYLNSELTIDNALGFMVIASTSSSDITDYSDGVYTLELTKDRLTELDKNNFYKSKDDKIEFKITLDGKNIKTIEYRMKEYAHTRVIKAEFISIDEDELTIPDEYKNASEYDENEECN